MSLKLRQNPSSSGSFCSIVHSRNLSQNITFKKRKQNTLSFDTGERHRYIWADTAAYERTSLHTRGYRNVRADIAAYERTSLQISRHRYRRADIAIFRSTGGKNTLHDSGSLSCHIFLVFFILSLLCKYS